jgi:hypothetical protein
MHAPNPKPLQSDRAPAPDILALDQALAELDSEGAPIVVVFVQRCRCGSVAIVPSHVPSEFALPCLRDWRQRHKVCQ